MLEAIHSGGQDGADLAGLAAGYDLGLRTGGWMPRGRRTDSGVMPVELFEKYHLREHPSAAYPPRTEANVLDADATVLFGNMSSPGCRLTINLCKAHGKPYLTIVPAERLGHDAYIMLVREFCITNDVKVLNVAGNRERTNPGIYATTYSTLIEALRG